MSTLPNVVQETKNYKQFKLLRANRVTNRGHTEALKQAYEEYGNLIKAQPILVNEKFEIIDGQHRFEACEELKQPIYYTVVPGLSVRDARSINLLHRKWYSDDYAYSYAAAGDKNYVEYLKLREDYGETHTVTCRYIANSAKHKVLRAFREGDLIVDDLPAIRQRLNYLKEVRAILPGTDQYLAAGILTCLNLEGFDLERMLTKLARHPEMYHFYSTIADSMRELEDIYNRDVSVNRVRLF